jgi:hypothetical protein
VASILHLGRKLLRIWPRPQLAPLPRRAGGGRHTARRLQAARANGRPFCLERLESRAMLDRGVVVLPDGSVEITLDVDFDVFGFHAETYQAFDGRAALGIFDTGASVITFSAADQEVFSFFGDPIPIKVPGGAVAEGVGGVLVGDVSMPGTVLVDGAHIGSVIIDREGWPVFEFEFAFPIATQVAAASTAQLFEGDASLDSTDGAYNGFHAVFSSGPAAGQVRQVADYLGATRTFTLAAPLPAAPQPGDEFTLVERIYLFKQGSVDDPAPSAGQFQGDQELSDYPNLYRGFYLKFTSGALAGEIQRISSYDGSARLFTFEQPFSQPPAAGDTFDIIEVVTSPSAKVPGIQAFVGVIDTSGLLPTITGTPILNPSPTAPNGLAAKIRPEGHLLEIDFEDFLPGFGKVVIPVPDLTFHQPGTPLEADVNTTQPLRMPVELLGANNYADPGMQMTVSPSPVVRGGLAHGSAAMQDLLFLFDTGAQLTTIPTRAADALGLDLGAPEFTISVQGAAGVVDDIPGFTISELSLPLEGGRWLRFKNVPVFVLDVAEELDGLLGMNLINMAHSVLYDPYDPAGPAVTFTYVTEPGPGITLPPLTEEEAQAAAEALSGTSLSLAALLTGSYYLPSMTLAQLSIGDTVVYEGQAGSTLVDITVSISAAPPADVTVDVRTADGTAQLSDGDYAPLAAQLVFTPAGPLTQTVTVEVYGDTKAEPHETILLVLENAAGAAIRKSTGTVTLLDDDPTLAILDSSGAPDDARIEFGTRLSQFRTRFADSPLVRPAYPDAGQYVDLVNAGYSPLVVEEIVVNAPHVSVSPALTAVADDDVVLGPGQVLRLSLTYTADWTGLSNPALADFDLAAGLVVRSTAVNGAERDVALAGKPTFHADLNYDGRVNFGELGLLNSNFGRRAQDAGWDPTADINGDGIINLGDLGLFNAQFGKARAAGAGRAGTAGAAAAAEAGSGSAARGTASGTGGGRQAAVSVAGGALWSAGVAVENAAPSGSGSNASTGGLTRAADGMAAGASPRSDVDTQRAAAVGTDGGQPSAARELAWIVRLNTQAERSPSLRVGEALHGFAATVRAAAAPSTSVATVAPSPPAPPPAAPRGSASRTLVGGGSVLGSGTNGLGSPVSAGAGSHELSEHWRRLDRLFAEQEDWLQPTSP